MAMWSTKRRLYFASSVALILTLLSFGVFWKIFYRTPTCSDGIKNGDEQGVDCGGSCQNICSNETISPIVLWAKVFNVSGDLYSAVALVENPNLNSTNPNANYKFSIYDTNNKLITVKEGQTLIPKGKRFAVFESGIVLKGLKPKSAEFEFTAFSPWQKDTSAEPTITLNYGELTSTSTSPRIFGSISNNSLQDVSKIELTVLVLDSNENAVAASRSYVDNLSSHSSQDFVFTWPKPFELGVESCSNPVDVSLALDRSESMRSESLSPPEPFTTVINTARDFIKNLSPLDRVAVISFGTNGREESPLSPDKKSSLSAINNLFLSTTTREQTNIYEGLSLAMNEFKPQDDSGHKQFIVLLTDGVPTRPLLEGQPDYPAVSATNLSQDIRDKKVTLYAIGLGKDVNSDFLKSISADPDHYFFSPTKEGLSSIYNTIGESLCQRKPNVITVLYKIVE